MPRWERFERVVDFVGVASTDCAVVHYLSDAIARFLGCDGGEIGLADGEEVWPEPPYQPFEKHLKDRGCDERVEEANNGVVDVPKAADSNLTNEDDSDGHERSEKCGGPFVPQS